MRELYFQHPTDFMRDVRALFDFICSVAIYVGSAA